MAREIKITEAHNPHLYDSNTGEVCVTEKVVEVTEDCPEAKNDKCIFLYTRANRRQIVQITRPYEGEEYMGMNIHFFIDELKRKMRTASRGDDIFGLLANQLGLSRLELCLLIEANAPA